MFKWLTSVKTAMCLIFLIVISSILATVLSEDLHIYQSFWYRGLLLLLCLNLIFCTVQKIPMVIKVLNEGPQLDNTPLNQEQIKLNDSPKTEKRILDTLKKEGYRIRLNNSKEISSIIAQKNRPNLLAPYFLHISLVIVFLGAFISSFGVNQNITCNVGQVVPLPSNLLNGVSIKMEDFKTLYDQNGNVDNWQSTFRLVKQGKLLEPQTVKVNHPFKYAGVKFYQSGYGYTGFHQYTVLNVKRDPGTPVVIIGMTLITLCSPFFWMGRYRKIRLKINHANKSMTVEIACKNREVKEKLKQSIIQRIRG